MKMTSSWETAQAAAKEVAIFFGGNGKSTDEAIHSTALLIDQLLADWKNHLHPSDEDGCIREGVEHPTG